MAILLSKRYGKPTRASFITTNYYYITLLITCIRLLQKIKRSSAGLIHWQQTTFVNTAHTGFPAPAWVISIHSAKEKVEKLNKFISKFLHLSTIRITFVKPMTSKWPTRFLEISRHFEC